MIAESWPVLPEFEAAGGRLTRYLERTRPGIPPEFGLFRGLSHRHRRRGCESKSIAEASSGPLAVRGKVPVSAFQLGSRLEGDDEPLEGGRRWRWAGSGARPKQALFVATSEIGAAENPFYRALNELLGKIGFDPFAEDLCEEFYAGNVGRPGIPPGVYFRMMMVGFLEGISSERGIAWRCKDSLSLRDFLGYGLTKNPPDHSSLSRTRKRLTVETHVAVFVRVLKLLDDSGLLGGGTLGVDSTTLEANAAMRSIVRRDGGTDYEEWLRELARASGIETPTREGVGLRR